LVAIDDRESRNKRITGVPFFVVDRPKSLELLEYCEISKQSGVFGLMGHANTSKSFQSLFRRFDCDNVIKAVDSGVFPKKGAPGIMKICLGSMKDGSRVWDNDRFFKGKGQNNKECR